MPVPSNEPASLPTMPTTHMMGHFETCQLITIINVIEILKNPHFNEDSHRMTTIFMPITTPKTQREEEETGR